MTVTRYYTATSIDGYIADARNSLDWLFQVSEAPENFGAFFAGVGAFAMGSTTYEWVLEHENVARTPQKWRDWYGSVPAWVFSSRELPGVPGADIRFVRGDVRPVHEAMVAAAAGKDLWIVGGGDLAGQFADAGLLDEIVLDVAPVTLGGGAPLLPRRITSERLSLASVERGGAFARLTYRLRPPDGETPMQDARPSA
jgi:dihydrofolate reductase